MRHFVIFLVLFEFVLLVLSENDAFAVCCFPYDMTHYIDPETGNLVVNGELWNDSYKGEPFGNSKYEFLFHNSTGGIIFEKELVITKGHPIRDGFVIHPGIIPLPFQITIDGVDSVVIKQVEHVSTGSTSVQYFEWKPPDLKVQLEEFKKIATIQSKTQENTFDKWRISGTITNTHSERTQNVYVLASMYNMDHNIVGVAGYSDEDIQPMVLNGHETKEFKIHALVPQEKSVQTVRLYAESDDSSMKYDKTKPIILKPGSYEIKHGVEETPITISANVTNITRDSIDFDWIIQIKKSPKSLSEGDITKYPQSTVEFVKMIPASMPAQDSQILEYSWVPQSGGIYFYEMFLWGESKPVSFPFTGSFVYSDQILVSTNSLKEQLAAGTPLEELQCRNNLVLANKATNANFVCVKPETKQKLIERGWAKSLGSVVSQKPSENILIPDNAVLQVTADAPCAWMTLQKLPHSELLKQHDRTGRNALMLEIDDDDIDKVQHLKEMLTAMQSESGFEPYEYDENTWQKRITSTESEQQQIWDWLKETSDSQFGQTTNSSFTTYFTYQDNYYHIIWALC